MRRAAALFHLMRAPRSLFISAIVFLALLAKTRDAGVGLAHTVPLLLICMIGFLINNLHDVEKDRQNHPDRPLPRGAISVATGAAAFFALLTAALAFIRLAMPYQTAFLYLLGILGMINYNYVVSYLWPLKNVYAAAVTTLPVFVIWHLSPVGLPLVGLSASLFLHTLGTEMLSDTRDWRGDAQTPAKWLGLRRATAIAFLFRLAASGLLIACAATTAGFFAAFAVLLLEAMLIAMWRSGFDRSLVSLGMKAQLALGACVLL